MCPGHPKRLVMILPVEARLKNFSPVDQNRYLCSVDPDETAHNEPSHQDLHVCHSVLDFTLKPLFEKVDKNSKIEEFI